MKGLAPEDTDPMLRGPSGVAPGSAERGGKRLGAKKEYGPFSDSSQRWGSGGYAHAIFFNSAPGEGTTLGQQIVKRWRAGGRGGADGCRKTEALPFPDVCSEPLDVRLFKHGSGGGGKSPQSGQMKWWNRGLNPFCDWGRKLRHRVGGRQLLLRRRKDNPNWGEVNNGGFNKAGLARWVLGVCLNATGHEGLMERCSKKGRILWEEQPWGSHSF